MTPNSISLGDLAFACYVYESMTGFDETVAEFRAVTGPDVDLGRAEHSLNLLHWLNHWGCRHLATSYHELASAGLARWYADAATELPAASDRLVSLQKAALERFALMFDSLSAVKAAERARGDRMDPVSFGPTAAAKTLFALRPHVFVAWDKAIRDELEHDGSGASYVRFLADVRGRLVDFAHQGVNLNDLPRRLGRPDSTAAELIDEYYWVTMTRGVTPPDRARLQDWLRLSPRT